MSPTTRDTDRLKDSLLHLTQHEKPALALSQSQRSIYHNLNALLLLGMPMKQLRHDDTDSAGTDPNGIDPRDDNPKKQKFSDQQEPSDARPNDYIHDTESDEEEQPTHLMQALTVHETSINPRWYVYKQNHSITAVMGYLQNKENVVFSPFSLMSCMAMMCRGASRGNAFQQLTHYCWPTDSSSPELDGASYQALNAFVTKLSGNQACNWTNIIVADRLRDEYKADIKKHFSASEFEPDQWSVVNDKVRSVTHMKDNVLPERPPASVLINAIYFMDKWMLPFNEGVTGMIFHTMNGQKTNVKMMTHRTTLRIAKHGDLTAVNMLYRTPGMGAWFVKNSSETGYKHDVAYTTLESFIQQEFVDQTLTSSEELLELNIPKFEMEESIDLKTLFKSLNAHAITDVFSPGNLDRMTDNSNECFSLFKQDCILKVDQKGTKAAAVTKAGTTRGGRNRPKYYHVTFAHTFYMVIYHNDAILFVAKIGCPTDRSENGGNPPTDDIPNTVDGHISSHFAAKELNEQTKFLKQRVMVHINGKQRFMQISTKAHDGKDDEDGEEIENTEKDKTIVTDIPHIDKHEDQAKPLIHIRTFKVPPDLLLRTTIKFFPPDKISDEEYAMGVDFTPVYVGNNGEEHEDSLHLLFEEPYELPFPLQKEAGEGEDAWHLAYTDDKGVQHKFLKIRFHLE